jgi:prefoldin subunit 5
VSEPLEQLEKLESALNRVLDLLTQAVQSTLEAVDLVDNYEQHHVQAPELSSAIKGLNDNIQSMTAQHNDVVAKIRAEKSDAAARQAAADAPA